MYYTVHRQAAAAEWWQSKPRATLLAQAALAMPHRSRHGRATGPACRETPARPLANHWPRPLALLPLLPLLPLLLLTLPSCLLASDDENTLAAFRASATADPEADLSSWVNGTDPCGVGWFDDAIGYVGVTCCADYGVSGTDCLSGNAQRVTKIGLYARPIAANVSLLAALTELEYLDLAQSDVFGDIAPLSRLSNLVLLDLLDAGVSGNATALRAAVPGLHGGTEVAFRYSYCSWHRDCPYRQREHASQLAGTTDDACCRPEPGPPVCDVLADLNLDAVGRSAGGGAVAHATDGSAPNFLMAVAVPGVTYTQGAATTQQLLSTALQYGTFTCDGGYTLDASVMFECGVAGGAATLSSQPCVAVCASLVDLDETAVRGCNKVVNATNGVGGFGNFTMERHTVVAGYQPYANGRAVAAMAMAYSVVGEFTCDDGMGLDPAATFLCTEAGGQATLSKQPCVPLIPDPAAALATERQDCLALISFQTSGEPWNVGTGEAGWTAGGGMWMDTAGVWSEARWSSGCQDFRMDCRVGLAQGRLNCSEVASTERQVFWREYCEEAEASGALNMAMRGVCPQRTAPECLLTCEICTPCDTETLQTDFGPCGIGWDDAESGWRGITCDEHRGRVTHLVVQGKAISADVGTLTGLEALLHLDLRNSSRIGGDVANLTALPVLDTVILTGTSVHSGAHTLAAGFGFCPSATSVCSRCEAYRGNSSKVCVTGTPRIPETGGDTSCNGPGVGNDDCACCEGSTSNRAYSIINVSTHKQSPPKNSITRDAPERLWRGCRKALATGPAAR